MKIQPLALLSLMLLVACDKDDVNNVVTPVDCENFQGTTRCSQVSTSDSAQYVETYLGDWYVAASQNSGFGNGDITCYTYTIDNSPSRFSLNTDGTWRSRIGVDDSTYTWTAINTSTGWTITSDQVSPIIPQPNFQCHPDTLYSDTRPVDGSLTVWVRE